MPWFVPTTAQAWTPSGLLRSVVNAACDWSGPVDLTSMDCGEHMTMGENSPEDVLSRSHFVPAPTSLLLPGPFVHIPSILTFTMQSYCFLKYHWRTLADTGGQRKTFFKKVRYPVLRIAFLPL